MQLKQLEKRWEEHHIPVTSAALALDPERMDHEQPRECGIPLEQGNHCTGGT